MDADVLQDLQGVRMTASVRIRRVRRRAAVRGALAVGVAMAAAVSVIADAGRLVAVSAPSARRKPR